MVDGDEIKRQAQAGGMGDQLYTIVYKQRIETANEDRQDSRRNGNVASVLHGYEDDNSAFIAERLAAKLPEWEANDIVPTRSIA